MTMVSTVGRLLTYFITGMMLIDGSDGQRSGENHQSIASFNYLQPINPQRWWVRGNDKPILELLKGSASQEFLSAVGQAEYPATIAIEASTVVTDDSEATEEGSSTAQTESDHTAARGEVAAASPAKGKTAATEGTAIVEAPEDAVRDYKLTTDRPKLLQHATILQQRMQQQGNSMRELLHQQLELWKHNIQQRLQQLIQQNVMKPQQQQQQEERQQLKNPLQNQQNQPQSLGHEHKNQKQLIQYQQQQPHKLRPKQQQLGLQKGFQLAQQLKQQKQQKQTNQKQPLQLDSQTLPAEIEMIQNETKEIGQRSREKENKEKFREMISSSEFNGIENTARVNSAGDSQTQNRTPKNGQYVKNDETLARTTNVRKIRGIPSVRHFKAPRTSWHRVVIRVPRRVASVGPFRPARSSIKAPQYLSYRSVRKSQGYDKSVREDQRNAKHVSVSEVSNPNFSESQRNAINDWGSQTNARDSKKEAKHFRKRQVTVQKASESAHFIDLFRNERDRQIVKAVRADNRQGADSTDYVEMGVGEFKIYKKNSEGITSPVTDYMNSESTAETETGMKRYTGLSELMKRPKQMMIRPTRAGQVVEEINPILVGYRIRNGLQREGGRLDVDSNTNEVNPDKRLSQKSVKYSNNDVKNTRWAWYLKTKGGTKIDGIQPEVKRIVEAKVPGFKRFMEDNDATSTAQRRFRKNMKLQGEDTVQPEVDKYLKANTDKNRHELNEFKEGNNEDLVYGVAPERNGYTDDEWKNEELSSSSGDKVRYQRISNEADEGLNWLPSPSTVVQPWLPSEGKEKQSRFSDDGKVSHRWSLSEDNAIQNWLPSGGIAEQNWLVNQDKTGQQWSPNEDKLGPYSFARRSKKFKLSFYDCISLYCTGMSGGERNVCILKFCNRL